MDFRSDSAFFNTTQQVSVTWQFECHVYSLAIFWFIIALYSFIVALNLRSLAPCKGLLCRICILLCTAGILRAVYLILDPYESKRRVSLWISRLLYILPWPIFTSSFIFVFLTLLHLTKINIYPYVLQNVKLLTIIMFSFTLVMAIFEVVNQYYVVVLPCYTLVICIFSFWTIIVCLAYFGYGALMLKSLTSAGDPTALRYCKYRKNKYIKNNVTSASLEPPKIRITDENDCTYSYRSETASPAVSEASDPSDSAEEHCDKDAEGFNESSPTAGYHQSSSNLNGGKQKTWINRKKDKKSSSSKKRRRAKSRSARLRMLVKVLFLPAILSLLSCAWLLTEMYYIFYTQRINKWEWFTVVSLSRLTEILMAIFIALATRCGFNRL